MACAAVFLRKGSYGLWRLMGSFLASSILLSACVQINYPMPHKSAANENHVPEVSSQTVNVAYNTATPITLSASDVDEDELSYSVSTSGIDATHTAHGTLSGTAPHLTYTPNSGFGGTDSFTYLVNDGTAQSATATVTISVAGPITPLGYTATLLSPTLTRKETASLRINCGTTSTHWILSANQPLADQSGWNACSGTVAFDTTVPIQDGTNPLKVWYKSNTQTVSTTAVTLDSVIKAESIELLDPIPTIFGGGDPAVPASGEIGFGAFISILPNGNLVAIDPRDAPPDDPVATPTNSYGAVHLYNGKTGALISTLSGNNEADTIGNYGITILSNGNYVVRSPYDDVNFVSNAGSVTLINGISGAVIATLSGDNQDDNFGLNPITVLPNGNYFVNSPNDDVNSVSDAGSVKLVNGNTGAVLASFAGESSFDNMGYRGVTLLTNGNYVLNAPYANVNTTDAGTVKLINGTTHLEISALSGDNLSDNLGSSGITALSNGNYVVTSQDDDVNSLTNAGSVKLVNGTTGAVIASINGDNSADLLGNGGVTELPNGHFVVRSSNDIVGSWNNAGSVKLVNGSTGAVIATLNGDNGHDLIGNGGITPLSNGNYVVASPLDDVSALIDAGSVKLINGTTGVVISSLNGNNNIDSMGIDGTVALPNGNFIVRSQMDIVNSIDKAGSVKLMNGTTGAEINSVNGDNVDDRIGRGGITVFLNGNFSVSSPKDDVNSLVDAGSVKLVNGTTGAVISSLEGDHNNEQIGFHKVTELSNGNYVIASPYDQIDAALTGSVKLFTAQGVEIVTLVGLDGDYLSLGGVVAHPNGSFMILSPYVSSQGVGSSGQILMVPGDAP